MAGGWRGAGCRGLLRGRQRLLKRFRSADLGLLRLPPGPSLGLRGRQLMTESCNLMHALAVNPLPHQSLNRAAITRGQGNLQSLDLRLAASLGRGSSGRSRSHRRESGELAIQQRADQQEQTQRQASQHPKAGRRTELPVGSHQHHG